MQRMIGRDGLKPGNGIQPQESTGRRKDMEKIQDAAETQPLEKPDWLWAGDDFDAWAYELAKSYEPHGDDQ